MLIFQNMEKRLEKVAIIIKRNKPEGLDLAKKLIPWLDERGVEAIFDKDVIGALGISKGYSKTEIHEIADLIIVLGGDGTLLSIARVAGKKSIPILGVNLGSLGFLTEMTVDELFPILERILEGKYDLEERMMLKASIYREGEKITEYSALNDVVISKGSMARIIDLDTRIDDNFLTLYRVDGLIFSTPTGSTGYSLAAAGPIVHPTLKAIIIAPICPFTLNNRPIMIPEQSKVSVTLKTENVDYLLTMDGQVAFALKEGDTIEIEKSESITKLVKSPYRDYYEVLRTKLKWSGSR